MIESVARRIFEVMQSFYVVPNFQREYVWGAEVSTSSSKLNKDDVDVEDTNRALSEDSNPVIRLADDIWHAANDTKNMDEPYYIGSIIICPDKKGETGVWKVIDGQQRLTTIYLFLIALRRLYIANGFAADEISQHLKGYVPGGNAELQNRLQLQYEDAGTTLQSLIDAVSDADIPTPTKYSEINLMKGYEKALAYLSEIGRTDANNLKVFYKFLISNVMVTRTETGSVERALSIFVTINDRGVGLTPMDLLKNLLFIEAKESQHENIHNKWDELLNLIEKADQGQPMRFLRYFYAAHYATKADGVVREREVYRLFDRNRETIGLKSKPMSVLNKMIESAKLYGNVRNGRSKDGKPLHSLQNIWHLGRTTFRQHYSALLAATHLNTEQFARIAIAVERLVAVSWISGRKPNQQEKIFAELSREIRTIKDSSSIEKVELLVNEHIEEMADEFAESIRNAREDKFTAYRFKYILARIAQYIDHGIAKEDGRESLDKYLPKTVNIEHILPKKGDEDKKAYAEFIGVLPNDPKLDLARIEAMRAQFMPRMANITLLTEEMNKSLGGKPYSIKKKGYSKDPFQISRQMPQRQPLSANGHSVSFANTLPVFTKWNEAELEIRATFLVYIAGQIWGVPVKVAPSDYIVEAVDE